MDDDELKIFIVDFLTKTDRTVTIDEILDAVNKLNNERIKYQIWFVLQRMFEDKVLNRETCYFLVKDNQASNPSQAPE
jgi:hypothetical protein